MKIKLLFLSLLISFTQLSFGQSEATYTVVFDSNWSQAAHPHSSGSLPSNAHWSRLVGATHNDGVVFWEMGGLATEGVEDVAELGSNTAFFNEVDAAISNGYSNQAINGPNLGTALGQMVINNLVTTEEYPYLTLLSMIAPSPDWMIGVNSIDLLDGNGDWKDEIIIELYPIDAGTDSGVDYDSSNMNTNPQEPISSLQGITPFSSEIIGTLTITLESVLGTNDLAENKITLYPNPAQNRFTVSHTNSLQSISVYNVLGAQVLKKENINAQTVEVDISALPSGAYLVKTISDSKQESVSRLIKL
ncbi:spondin domain-containing protein [Aureisphaera galaxeae]|uniref:T9SS type A sorting domain-containing protein n=1 Tax=Aureisphaera galaxeae TaxID=1538023 RepID=UPI00235045E0|nr:spondin domain-containing protein [Aureisphaera galaxeae]MDC8006347.1 spondin domain-containing protein [Aureisphaera galaxeae]